MTYTMEQLFEIWNDKEGFHYEISDDRDGLGLIEIRYYENGKTEAADRMTFDRPAAHLLVEALTKKLNEDKKNEILQKIGSIVDRSM